MIKQFLPALLSLLLVNSSFATTPTASCSTLQSDIRNIQEAQYKLKNPPETKNLKELKRELSALQAQHAIYSDIEDMKTAFAEQIGSINETSVTDQLTNLFEGDNSLERSLQNTASIMSTHFILKQLVNDSTFDFQSEDATVTLKDKINESCTKSTLNESTTAICSKVLTSGNLNTTISNFMKTFKLASKGQIPEEKNNEIEQYNQQLGSWVDNLSCQGPGCSGDSIAGITTGLAVLASFHDSANRIYHLKLKVESSKSTNLTSYFSCLKEIDQSLSSSGGGLEKKRLTCNNHLGENTTLKQLITQTKGKIDEIKSFATTMDTQSPALSIQKQKLNTQVGHLQTFLAFESSLDQKIEAKEAIRENPKKTHFKLWSNPDEKKAFIDKFLCKRNKWVTQKGALAGEKVSDLNLLTREGLIKHNDGYRSTVNQTDLYRQIFKDMLNNGIDLGDKCNPIKLFDVEHTASDDEVEEGFQKCISFLNSDPTALNIKKSALEGRIEIVHDKIKQITDKEEYGIYDKFKRTLAKHIALTCTEEGSVDLQVSHCSGFKDPTDKLIALVGESGNILAELAPDNITNIESMKTLSTLELQSQCLEYRLLTEAYDTCRELVPEPTVTSAQREYRQFVSRSQRNASARKGHYCVYGRDNVSCTEKRPGVGETVVLPFARVAAPAAANMYMQNMSFQNNLNYGVMYGQNMITQQAYYDQYMQQQMYFPGAFGFNPMYGGYMPFTYGSTQSSYYSF